MLLYYITDRHQFPGNLAEQRQGLLEKIEEAARAGVDFVQLREKDLSGRELEALAVEAVRLVRDTASDRRRTLLLINSRSDVALAAGADGVHLPSKDISPGDARAIFDISTRNRDRNARRFVVAASCHTVVEVRLAESQGADVAVFGPVFEKTGKPGAGLEALRQACRRGQATDGKTEAVRSGTMPVLALGGVTLENARACLEVGAGGVAGIRLFQQNEISAVVRGLRAL